MDIQQSTVAVVLAIGRPGTRANVKSGIDTGDTDPNMVHISKDLIDKGALKKVRAIDTAARAWVRGRSLPSPLFKGGVYLVPLPSLPTSSSGRRSSRSSSPPTRPSSTTPASGSARCSNTAPAGTEADAALLRQSTKTRLIKFEEE